LGAQQPSLDPEIRSRRVLCWMRFDHCSMHGPEFRARRLESCTKSELAKEFRHAMNASVLHGRGEMVRAGHNVRNDFGICRILDRGFEDADDSGGPIAEAGAEAKDLTDDGRIALESARPEMIGQVDHTGGFRTVVCRPDETA